MTSSKTPWETPARNHRAAQGSSATDRLIVALDFPDATQALTLVDSLNGQCRWFKVGLELYLAAGNSIVETLKNRGFSVFLDLKLHDIPNLRTTGRALKLPDGLHGRGN